VIEPIELEFTVACSPEHAFEVWATRASLWWPHAHSRSGGPGLTVTFEPRRGGRIYERTTEGVEHDWGEVTVWQPPNRLAYLWHIYGDRADATEVEVVFTGRGDSTRVSIVHGGWDRLGDRAADLRDLNRAGWAGVIPPYRAGCSSLAAGE